MKPFIAGLVVYLLLENMSHAAALVILLLMLSDIFDGVLFRRSKMALKVGLPRLRRIVDIIGDKISVHTLSIVMMLHNHFPWYFYTIILIRDLLLLSIWLYGMKSGQPLGEPNLFSRLSMLCVGFVAISWLTLPVLTAWFLFLGVGFAIPGIFQYWRTTKRVVIS